MMDYSSRDYDIIVIGAGHAGCEAALASARLKCKTLLLTLNMDQIALLPCNPSIGGPAKGQLVREIDALGGEMGINIDKSHIQIRMLNTGKGPAVHALRAQADKKCYQKEMTMTLETQENLDVKQDTVDQILIDHYRVTGVATKNGARYNCRAVVLTTGTYLRGRIIIGEVLFSGGPNGQQTSVKLVDSLKDLGFEVRRFKTGTPARVDRRTIDFEKTVRQPGDNGLLAFSYLTERFDRPNIPCWLTYSNEKTHEVIRKNLHRAPLYSGIIEGVGPRYCPSIEDKIVRFPDKNAHQIFLEPEGLGTLEYYVQGTSTSLPVDVQAEILRSIKGLERVEIMRPAYAIEYDCINPTQLRATLESKFIEGLYTAGQINGSSGYEEAAAQGLIAGINAVLQLREKEPLVLKRSEAYIGVLIDDLVTKGTNEPYRMLTSRAEYRLLLRQDNADLRVTEIGWKIGLVNDQRWSVFEQKKKDLADVMKWINTKKISPKNEGLRMLLDKKGYGEAKNTVSFMELMKRPEISFDDVVVLDGDAPKVGFGVSEQVEIQVKYQGYIKKQMEQVERFIKLENRRIPDGIEYQLISGLRKEARQKLDQIKPHSIGQASRISGVSPADISVLLVYLEQRRRMGEKENH